jgi:hypothetical protein
MAARKSSRGVGASRAKAQASKETKTAKSQSRTIWGTEAADLGRRLRYHRENVLRDTIGVIHERCGVSENTLRKLEDGTGQIGLGRLLNALRQGYKLRGGLQEALSLPRCERDTQPIARWSGGDDFEAQVKGKEVDLYQVGEVKYYRVLLRKRDPQMEVFIGVIPPGKDTGDLLNHRHGGDEVLMTLKGRTELVRVMPDGEEITETVKLGALVLHRGSVEHYARNPLPDRQCVYLVIRSPAGIAKPPAPYVL